MPRNRFPLSMLMVLIAVLALGLAALKVASEGSARLMIAVATVVLLAGTVGVIVRRPRGGWVGFAVFGWFYTIVLLGVPVLAVMLPTIAGEVSDIWQVDILVIDIVDRIHPEPPESAYVLPQTLERHGDKFYGNKGEVQIPATELPAINAHLDLEERRQAWYQSQPHARKVAYALQGLIFALLGGVVGRALERPRLAEAGDTA